MGEHMDRPPFHECEDDSGWTGWPTRDLDDGRLLAFEPLLFNAVRIHVVGNRHDYGSMEVYEWQDRAVAAEQFRTWNGDGEPEGWYRHKPSNRRRPGGDPSKEYVYE